MKELDIEVPSQKIFEKMKLNSFSNFQNYSNLSINKDYLSQRDSILKTIHNITIQLGYKSQTFFLSSHFLDIISLTNIKISENIFKLGLACLCLASKFCENDPNVPHLKFFVRIYNNIVGFKNIISTNNLLNAEVFVCKLLNYKLNYFTVYDFNTFFFSHGLLKFEQLEPIENKLKISNKNNKKEMKINSKLVKIILTKIYKKSRYYLDNVIKIYEICAKYNPLFISLLIMKKSIDKVLEKEQNINLYDEKYQKEFHEKNNICFKEIMNDYYKIDYESNEEYLELLLEPEIQNIFSPKEYNITKIKNINENNRRNKSKTNRISYHFRNLSRPPQLSLSKEKNKNSIEVEYNTNTILTNSVSNGFYRKLKLRPNHRETTSSLNEKNILTLRKMNNIDNNTIDILENIKKLRVSGRIREDKLSLFNNTYKSIYNSSINKQKLTKKIIPQSNSSFKINNNSINKFSTRNGFGNSINNSEYSINLNKGEKEENHAKSKNNGKNSSIKYESIYSNDNFNNYIKINKYLKNIENIKINNTNKKNSYSHNKSINNKENNENNDSKNNTNNSNIEQKTYIKKSINISNRDITCLSKKNLRKTSTSNCFSITKKNNIKNSNINLSTNLNTILNITDNFNTIEDNSSNILNIYKFKRKSKKYSFYTRVKLKQNNESNEINNNNINICKTLNIDTNEIVKNSSKTKNGNNIMKKKEFIYENEGEIHSKKDNNSNDNINILNSNQKEEKNKELNKITNFNPEIFNKNKIYVNTSKNLEMKNINNIKTERSKKLAYLLSQKNSEINNILKEINLSYAKNLNSGKIQEKNIKENGITVNTLNKNNELNLFKKLDLSKNKYKNNRYNNSIENQDHKYNYINNDNKNNKSTSYSKHYFNIKNNSEKNIFLFKNNLNNNNINNNICNNNLYFSNPNPNISEVKENQLINKNKNLPQSSVYKLITRARNVFTSVNKEENDELNHEDNNFNNKSSKLNFYKSKQNFYNNKNNFQNKERMININLRKNKIDKQKFHIKNNGIKSKKSSFIKNEINIKKFNIDNISCQTQDNSSTIIINNTININFSNKKNLNGQIINYNNNYKENKNQISKINLNRVFLNSGSNQKIKNHNGKNKIVRNNMKNNIDNSHIMNLNNEFIKISK